MIRRFAPLAAAALLAAGCDKKTDNGAAPAATSGPVVAPPAAGWAETVVETPEGGFRMGNPDAAVKVVEFGSLTCPHCADFSAESSAALASNYVASGKVSFELRNFVRDGADITASLISRCGGPGPYFKLTEQIWAAQMEWYGKLQKLTPEDYKVVNAMPPEQQPAWLANATGLVDFARQRGIPGDKVNACISDKKAQDALAAMRDKATSEYGVNGTPTFLINGENVGTLTWPMLEAKLKEAVG